EECLRDARRHLGARAGENDVRRAANRLFVRRCMTHAAWSRREAAAGRGGLTAASAAHIAVLRRAIVA
ncbi:MAG TPA: hypothetical protein VI997_12220, partial [Candidatus Thermoplasmatota archaeon]|nr:hypothetical protein [Candidatus Thermoplasmatota archaeon]